METRILVSQIEGYALIKIQMYFRVLVIMDKLVSAFVGRPCALHEEESVVIQAPSLRCLLTLLPAMMSDIR